MFGTPKDRAVDNAHGSRAPSPDGNHSGLPERTAELLGVLFLCKKLVKN